MTGINRVGQSLLLGIIFLVGCIPIVTIGTSITSFYYAMMKSVRCERSYPVKEFWSSYRRNLLKGTAYTVVLAAIVYLCFISRQVNTSDAVGDSVIIRLAVNDVILGFTAAFAVWIFPVISRFDVDIKRTVMLTFTMAVKYFYFTLALVAGAALSAFLIVRLSVGFTLLIPAAACYGSTYIIEPVFRKFIPKPADDEDGWYYYGPDRER